MRLDPTRLAALRRAMILDSGPERAFDDITRLMASTLSVPITMVNLLDAERDWFKSRVGLPQTESPAATSVCEAFFDSDCDLIVVEDTRLDRRLCNHPLVLAPPHIRFYAAARLSIAGQTWGTLCAYDLRPRQITPEQCDKLRTMSRAVVDLLAQRGACNAKASAVG